jgi:hypothetical protein
MFKNLFGSKKEELPMEVIEQPEIETSVDMNTEEFDTPMYTENDVELETASLVDLEILEEEELSVVDFGTEDLLNNPWTLWII